MQRKLSIRTASAALDLSRTTYKRYCRVYAGGGASSLFLRYRSKSQDDRYRNAVFELLHEPPSALGINRTSRRLDDLRRILTEKGLPISTGVLSKILQSAGCKWRQARVVLASTNPSYREKLDRVRGILERLGENEALFSIDEYGPFAIKMKPKQRSPLFVWLILLLGSLVAVEGAVSVWVAMKVASGESATGRVIEFHHSGSGSRSASVVGQVDVVMPGGATFRDEVDDAMGSQDWVVGGNVALRCTHFYADHWSCSADSGFARFLFPLFFLTIGVGMVSGSARNICGRLARVDSPEPSARE